MQTPFIAFSKAPRTLFRQWQRHAAWQKRYPGLVLSFPITLQYDDLKAIAIGDDVLIGAFGEIVVFSNSTFSPIPGALLIGDRVIIGSHVNIRAAGGRITIGNNTLIAQNVSLIASNHIISHQQPYRDLPWDTTKVGVEIGENVWLGAGVTVLPGCQIGNNAVVGAGSIVTKSIPANEIWVGTPAKKLRNVDVPRPVLTL
jgi:acetyltransferase-like isoleucine patch superfamily enzyme